MLRNSLKENVGFPSGRHLSSRVDGENKKIGTYWFPLLFTVGTPYYFTLFSVTLYTPDETNTVSETDLVFTTSRSLSDSSQTVVPKSLDTVNSKGLEGLPKVIEPFLHTFVFQTRWLSLGTMSLIFSYNY